MNYHLLQPEIQCPGHSGCRIDIVGDNGKHLLRKTSSSPEYNDRLSAQIEKQRRWNNQYVKAPSVYSSRICNSLLQVDMEYIFGVGFIRYFEVSTFTHIINFIELLIDYIEEAINKSQNMDVTKIVNTKVQSVREKLTRNHFAKEFVDLIPEPFEISLPVGECHGDLTFSNILWHGNNIFVIDFLDSFIESPLIDIVKLRQDTFHFWSLDRDTSGFDRAKVSLILSYLDKILVDHFNRYQWFCEYYKFFQRLNLCRVLQYSESLQITNKLVDEINRIDLDRSL